MPDSVGRFFGRMRRAISDQVREIEALRHSDCAILGLCILKRERDGFCGFMEQHSRQTVRSVFDGQART